MMITTSISIFLVEICSLIHYNTIHYVYLFTLNVIDSKHCLLGSHWHLIQWISKTHQISKHSIIFYQNSMQPANVLNALMYTINSNDSHALRFIAIARTYAKRYIFTSFIICIYIVFFVKIHHLKFQNRSHFFDHVPRDTPLFNSEGCDSLQGLVHWFFTDKWL